MQRTMVEIIKACNIATPTDPPDDFDPSPFLRPSKPDTLHEQNANNKQGQANQPDTIPKSRPTHSPDGLLYSTSTRPGASQYQHVQYNMKTNNYKAIVPHQGKRHSFGPFKTDIEAAIKVWEFLQRIQAGEALPTRGEKRTEKFHHQLADTLNQMNSTAESEKRHFVIDTENPMCKFCKQKVHTYHAITFAERPCNALTDMVDKKGSTTRAAKLSEARTAELQRVIDEHNRTARAKRMHYISQLNPPTCSQCSKTVTRAYLKKWMIKDCPEAQPENHTDQPPPHRKRLHGKQRDPSAR